MTVSNYQQALDYLYQNLPMFHRVGAAALKPDLTNTIQLCNGLNNPERNFPSIHVAGTNGKGSTCHMLASILQSAGYKTGLFTSPHLKDFTERIRVNGKELTHDFVIDFINLLHTRIQAIKPSFFEMTVAMAFQYFSSENVDIAVIEVGLGGRLDSTNVINPVVSVITSIGWDHKELLGNTLPEIAREKAGIIKDQTPVVISERQESVEKVFITKAREHQAPLVFASDRYKASFTRLGAAVTCSVWKDGRPFLENVDVPLQAKYQEKNLPGVLQAIETLNSRGFQIGNEQIRHGLEHVILQTNLKGRWQKLNSRPLVICDTGHNIDGVQEVVRQIRGYNYSKLHIVWGMVKDKDTAGILSVLPKDASYYFCEAKIPRALDATTLSRQAAAAGLHGLVIADVNEALSAALQAAAGDDFIFIGGSTFVVAEIEGL
jgi:dihydrofolate synthase / folylpolyglutamate synthase